MRKEYPPMPDWEDVIPANWPTKKRSDGTYRALCFNCNTKLALGLSNTTPVKRYHCFYCGIKGHIYEAKKEWSR